MSYLEQAKKKAQDLRDSLTQKQIAEIREREYRDSTKQRVADLLKQELKQFDGQGGLSYEDVYCDYKTSELVASLLHEGEPLLDFVVEWGYWEVKYSDDSLTKRENGPQICVVYRREYADYRNVKKATYAMILPEEVVKYCMTSVASYLSKFF